jgi:16S rRNA (adenine1518-N6/adenine1519-N6)-dimethyltransferase
MASPVRAKKHLGQHFLRDENIAMKIVDGLAPLEFQSLVEVGPGDGVLSKYLFEKYKNLELFDIDQESIDYLKRTYPMHMDKIKFQDFLHWQVEGDIAVIGNFPYNISSQIVFKILENKQHVVGMVGMFQKEVAERIASKKGSRVYGIMSVLTQAYYDVEYLFTVDAQAFEPPPKVQSGVIILKRKEKLKLDCDEKAFKSIVKRAFNQRRKMLRKSLKDLIDEENSKLIDRFLTMRPEQLDFTEFVELTNALAPLK